MSQAGAAVLERDYEICGEIGRGRYGIVYRCRRPKSLLLNNSDDDCAQQQQLFAVKSIDKESISSGDQIDSQCLLKEPKILFLLSSHPNIIRIYDVYNDPSHLHMVLDLCNCPDLYQVISHNAPIPEPEAARIFVQLMRAVAHCHRLGVAHRDIKPDNILFHSDHNRLKLADFGSADLFQVDKTTMTGVVGTPYYMAPEVISGGRRYTEKVDVWSAGVVLYTMLVKLYPFSGDSLEEIFETVVRANLRFPVTSVSPAAKDLLRRMLCKDVSRRFSAHQVLRHPWLTTAAMESV